MQPGTPGWAQFVPLIIVAVLIIVRFIRPQRISVTRMWISPIILCGLAAFVIYGNEKLQPAPFWAIALGLAVGLLAGIPFGILRGMHTDVRPTDRPGVMYLGSSWITMAIFVGAFALRFAVRSLMPQQGAMAGVIGDGLLAFAIAFIATSYVVIFRKYEAALSS
jgi:hypothetical protein